MVRPGSIPPPAPGYGPHPAPGPPPAPVLGAGIVQTQFVQKKWASAMVMPILNVMLHGNSDGHKEASIIYHFQHVWTWPNDHGVQKLPGSGYHRYQLMEHLKISFWWKILKLQLGCTLRFWCHAILGQSPRDWRTVMYWNVVLTIFHKLWDIWSLWKIVRTIFQRTIVLQLRREGSKLHSNFVSCGTTFSCY